MSSYDKIVLHSIYMSFQLIFNRGLYDQQLNTTENNGKMKKSSHFKPSSYGISFGKSCHEVLNDIQT